MKAKISRMVVEMLITADSAEYDPEGVTEDHRRYARDTIDHFPLGDVYALPRNAWIILEKDGFYITDENPVPPLLASQGWRDLMGM